MSSSVRRQTPCGSKPLLTAGRVAIGDDECSFAVSTDPHIDSYKPAHSSNLESVFSSITDQTQRLLGTSPNLWEGTIYSMGVNGTVYGNSPVTGAPMTPSS